MLKRETKQQLLRDLIARGASPDRRTPPGAIVVPLLLLALALYWLIKI